MKSIKPEGSKDGHYIIYYLVKNGREFHETVMTMHFLIWSNSWEEMYVSYLTIFNVITT